MTSVSRQTAVRFTAADDALLDALRERIGVQSTTEVVRLALRTLAEKFDVTAPPAPLVAHTPRGTTRRKTAPAAAAPAAAAPPAPAKAAPEKPKAARKARGAA